MAHTPTANGVPTVIKIHSGEPRTCLGARRLGSAGLGALQRSRPIFAVDRTLWTPPTQLPQHDLASTLLARAPQSRAAPLKQRRPWGPRQAARIYPAALPEQTHKNYVATGV